MIFDNISDPPSPAPSSSLLKSNTDGNLLILLIGLLYGFFTFNSSNQTILWPWVVLWQATLILPMLWLLWQVWSKPLAQFRLGNGFDWLAGLAVLGLLVSTLAADFPQQAIWYGIGILGGFAALYGLMGWLTPTRVRWLLVGQGYLSLAFMVSSLGLWWFNIYRPELQRLEALRARGIEQSFNFDVISLRNWYPLGHQNYVAGYLVLVLPLLVGLALTDKTRQRWLWVGAIALGLVDLYTTNSRGAVLALLAMLIPVGIAILLSRQIAKRLVLAGGLAGVAVVALLALANPRIRASLVAVSQGDVGGGQLAYRVINNVIGWRMGQARPWAGMGPGSVLPLFQRYRPVWAGREAELHYQLHSTPAQLWAELGLWGILLPLVAAGLLGYALWRRQRRPASEAVMPTGLLWSLIVGLWGFAVLSLTDYHLDVIAISGVIVIFLAIALFDLRQPLAETALEADAPRRRHWLTLSGVGLVLALVIWLIPVHRAWATSARGFVALQKNDLEGFVSNLQQAHQLAPWEPYYPYQLGWVLGNLSYQVEEPKIAEQLRSEAITWFRQGNELSPFQEFGHSNLGWLEIQETPATAIAHFAQSATLLPAKTGVFYGIGAGYFLQDQLDLAAEAIALEIIRNPIVIPNLPLNGGPLTELYPTVAARVEAVSAEILATTDAPAVRSTLHQTRGTLRWWLNDYDGAAEDWEQSQDAISLAILTLAQGETPDVEALPDLPGKFAIQAWLDPENRQQWLETAWLAYDEELPQFVPVDPPAEPIEALVTTMNESATFDQWLKQNAVFTELRGERLGFGVLMRHDDGPNPSDFYIRRENLAMARFFETLMPSPSYLPELDGALQPFRQAIIDPAIAPAVTN